MRCKESLITPENSSKRIWPAWLIWLGLSFALYALTANRGPQWQDSGSFILRIMRGELGNPLGIALAHPLHYWIGRGAIRIPGLEPAFAITLISSLGAAICVANLFGCVVSLTGNRAAAALAAASLMVANTFWQLATLVETYSLSAAFLTAKCWCLVLLVQLSAASDASGRNRTRVSFLFMSMWLLNGLSFANHNLALLTAVMLVAVSAWAIHRRAVNAAAILMAIGLWVVGAVPILWLIVRELIATADLPGTIRSTLFGTAFQEQVLSVSPSGQLLMISVGFVVLNFPNLLLPAAVYGIWHGRRESGMRTSLGMLFVGFTLHALFAFRYPVPDQHYFFLSTYVFLCLFGGVGFAIGFDRFQDRGRRRLQVAAWGLVLATPVVYSVVPAAFRRIDLLGFVERNKPYRDDYTYLFIPWTFVERSAAQMSDQAADLAGPNGAIIVEDGMAQFAVKYALERRKLSGVDVFVPEMPPKEMEAAFESGRKIILVPHNADHPTTLPLRGTWKRIGDLYELVPDAP